MFYSHEILTSRKYGVATVWLVATLGSRSTLKKINRKAILNVDVSKACQMIVAPEAPMALRLQGNLLYGVSRVYSQQCGYVLADAQQAQSSLMTLQKIVRISELDERAGRARPDQLILPDDPAFLPDLALANIDLSLLSIHDAQLSPLAPSVVANPLSTTGQEIAENVGPASLGIVVPTPEPIRGDEVGGLVFPSKEATVAPASVAEAYQDRHQGNDDVLLPSIDFEFDAEGNLQSLELSDTAEATGGLAAIRLKSDAAASDQVRREHVEGRRARRDLDKQLQIEDNEVSLEFEYDLPEALPFSIAGEMDHTSRGPPKGISAQALVTLEQAMDVDVPAPRRPRVLKTIEADLRTEIRPDELSGWGINYINYMESQQTAKQISRISRLAKMNAVSWVYGNGIANVGLEPGAQQLHGSLMVFSGQRLIQLLSPVITGGRSPKRKTLSDEAQTSGSEERRVRPRRQIEEQTGRGSGTFRGNELEDIPAFDELDIEVGRDAAPELQDQSTAMPWNIVASARGSRFGSSIGQGRGPLSAGPPTSAMRQSTVYGAELNFPSRQVSRITSASPQVGKETLGGLARLSSLELRERAEDTGLLSELIHGGSEALEDFEFPGPPAAEPQLATDEPPTRQGLDQDSTNFLQYILTNVEQAQQQDPTEEETMIQSVKFEVLLPPMRHSKVVAAQAFHHTLLLATRNVIAVEQATPFGDIWMTPVVPT